MEKRLFLAVFLSLGIVFFFQIFFGQKPTQPQPGVVTQVQGNKEVVSDNAPVEVKMTASSKQSGVAFKEELLVLKNNTFNVEFSNKGGNIVSVEEKRYGYVFPAKNYVSLPSFNDMPFQVYTSTAQQVVFQYKNAEWEIRKTYTLADQNAIKAKLSVKNISAGKLSFMEDVAAFVVDLSRVDNNEHQSDWTLREYSIKTDKNVIRKNNVTQLNQKWNKEEEKKVGWFGFRNKYFCTIAQPAFGVGRYSIKALSDKELSMGTKVSSLNMSSGDVVDYDFLIYVGPQTPALLKAQGDGFEKIFAFSDWGWLDAISKVIYWALGAIHKVIPIWGICIVLISLIVYGLMYPLTLKSLTSMRKMQLLQPKIKALQEKHKKAPEKLNQEIVLLYKENNVNPLSGCLPMLLQMPIFVGLYQVLWRSIYFRGEPFLWMKDLSLPDRLFKLPVNIPFVGEYFNILPIVMVVVMALQQQISMKSMVADSEQASQQKFMATFFPIFIGFIFYQFSSGLNLYFVVFYILSALTQWNISRDKVGA